jgi:hypothetical protein
MKILLSIFSLTWAVLGIGYLKSLLISIQDLDIFICKGNVIICIFGQTLAIIFCKLYETIERNVFSNIS